MTDYPNHEHRNADVAAYRRLKASLATLGEEAGRYLRRMEGGADMEYSASDADRFQNAVNSDVREWHAADVADDKANEAGERWYDACPKCGEEVTGVTYDHGWVSLAPCGDKFAPGDLARSEWRAHEKLPQGSGTMDHAQYVAQTGAAIDLTRATTQQVIEAVEAAGATAELIEGSIVITLPTEVAGDGS